MEYNINLSIDEDGVVTTVRGPTGGDLDGNFREYVEQIGGKKTNKKYKKTNKKYKKTNKKQKKTKKQKTNKK